MRDQNKLKNLSKELIKEIGEDPSRSGLKDTPKRMAKMYLELFKGYDKSQMPEITIFPNNDDNIHYNQLITDQGRFNSFCEHHMSLFYGDYYFGYIPGDYIIGLSKVARLIDYFSSRMQVQERLGEDVVRYIEKKINPQGVMLVLKGTHTCKCVRGAKKDGVMTTSIVKGEFEKDKSTREEFFNLLNL